MLLETHKPSAETLCICACVYLKNILKSIQNLYYFNFTIPVPPQDLSLQLFFLISENKNALIVLIHIQGFQKSVVLFW